ncbi:putative Endonuclease NucS [Clostridium botulinum]|uniref:endonuclease NucS domain-containing protein n=1 Tax=Clostridium botulinum TaxID=1491 RepID=UPI000581F5F1|nr:endonuclease NucS domain-containing protein [Clostridium botulinum]BAQ12843.1 putative Endonuclease NucS [Clostridium botulinum]
MENIESIIRDYLCKNLDFISKDLRLVKKEYKLENVFGTKGFIDILARDAEDNYVIIEIKRSNQASRQAIHEISKYAALLKYNLKVKDSEIRLVIISTTWEELIVPYSEFHNNNNYYLEGYKINLDSNNIPINKEKIKPLNLDIERSISRSQHIFLYSNNDKLNKKIEKISALLPKYGINDFIIVQMTTDNDIPYPNALYLVHQRYSKEYYLNLLKIRLQNNKSFSDEFIDLYDEALELEEIYDLNSQEESEEYYISLEGIFLQDFIEKMGYDDYEIGYPEKFMITISSEWSVQEVICNGLFEKDKLFSNVKAIREIMSINESNLIIYSNQSTSNNNPKINEIFNRSINIFYSNKIWKHHISRIYDKLRKERKKYNISVIIFNPENILECIINKIEPQYEIVIEYIDEQRIDIYRGMIRCISKEISLNDIVSKHFKYEFNIFMNIYLHTIHDKELSIMNDLGMEYASEVIMLRNNDRNIYNLLVDYDDIILDEKESIGGNFIDYLNESNKFRNELIQCFKRSTVGYFK